MEREAQVQEDEYRYPYHHLPEYGQLVALPNGLRLASPYLARLEAVREMISALGDGPVLDAGCGDGRLLKELHAEGADVIGIDRSYRALVFSRAFLAKARVALADLTQGLPFPDEHFRAVVLVETLEHIDPSEMASVLDELRRVLLPGGGLVLTVPHVNLSVPDKHYRHFTLGSLREVLEPRFTIEWAMGLNRSSRTLKAAFRILCLAYYLCYAVPRLRRVVGGWLWKAGDRYYRRFLFRCRPDEGTGLIAVCRVRPPE